MWCNFTPRQSITFTKPNNQWLKEQVASKEYSSKSELVNDLIRRARSAQARIEWIRQRIEKAEESGLTEKSKVEILAKAKKGLNE